MNVLMLSREKRWQYEFFAQALNRIEKFCGEHDSDADPKELTRAIERDFTADEHVYGIVVAESEGRVTGHLLASVDQWYQKKFLTILQYELDEGVARETLKAGFELICDWGNLNQCEQVQALVADEAHARRLQLLWGFHKHKTLMRREI